ncbi:MAG: type II toxin-antitoxin system YafQ family toxin [Clostridiales bacterium]|jgi:mRNA interferase YafQ|nr:type II toxin-antitoxin system YafQ family toxin [Clostridiales bacterium]
MINFGSKNKYEITMSGKFRRNMKLAKKRGLDLDKLKSIVHNLANDIPLDPKHNDHQLKGDMRHFRECHITPDWLLVYEKTDSTLILYLYSTGTHADLF